MKDRALIVGDSELFEPQQPESHWATSADAPEADSEGSRLADPPRKTSRQAMDCRSWEPRLLAGQVIFDIGAHVGFYTLLGSVLIGASGRVSSFEPLPANVGFLLEHLALNRLQNVTVIEAAVSDESHASRFTPGSDTSMGMLDRR